MIQEHWPGSKHKSSTKNKYSIPIFAIGILIIFSSSGTVYMLLNNYKMALGIILFGMASLIFLSFIVIGHKFDETIEIKSIGGKWVNRIDAPTDFYLSMIINYIALILFITMMILSIIFHR